MRYKTGLNLAKIYSQNFTAPKRKKKYIKFIIIHYTGMKKESDAIKRLCNPNSKVSAHYFIKNNGQILILVPETYIAWHAGKSSWKSYKSLNKYSIGIEISNPGHTNNYKNFSNKQIVSVKRLVKFLIKKYNIKVENLLGHSDIAPSRKVDPGEKFPWKKLSIYNLGKWFKKKPNNFSQNKKKIEILFFKNLKKIGYKYFNLTKRNATDRRVIKSFQLHYLPKNVTGKIDKKTHEISHFLAK